MGSYRSSPAVAVLLLTIFIVSSALNMSIISYNNNLGDGKFKEFQHTSLNIKTEKSLSLSLNISEPQIQEWQLSQL
ncbi:hypothetical protein ACFX1Q_020408 [Malus domestica]